MRPGTTGAAALRWLPWVVGAAVGAAALVPALAQGQAADRSDEALRRAMERARGGTPVRVADCQAGAAARAPALQEGEAALRRGEPSVAQLAFERAAATQHCADVEMGLVRTYLQGGQYRRAMAFVAHTAQAHRDTTGGTALYAWLLHAGGYTRIAQQMLDQATQRWGADPLLEATRAQLRSGTPVASGALLDLPVHAAPHAWGAAVPEGARVVASGLLFDGGRRALVPWGGRGDDAPAWLRDGLGRTVAARVERRLGTAGLAVLVTEPPHVVLPALPLAPRDPFPGSPGHVVEYAPAPGSAAAWPLLHAGFIGMPGADGRRLGIDLPRGPRGGPVFDALGRLIGVTAAAEDGRDRLVPVSALRAWLGDSLGAAADAPAPASAARAATDEIYETGLRHAIQVIVTAP